MNQAGQQLGGKSLQDYIPGFSKNIISLGPNLAEFGSSKRVVYMQRRTSRPAVVGFWIKPLFHMAEDDFHIFTSPFFQSELLRLFLDKDHVKQHYEVLRFAAGLSPKVGAFLCQHHIKAGRIDEEFLNLLRENEEFSQDIFCNIPSIESIHLRQCHLREVELQSLGNAVCEGKLPRLVTLSLDQNILTGCLGNLLVGPDHLRFTSLKKLDLGDTHLNREDMESLNKAITGGKLPQLTVLNLRLNTLTGCMSSLMGGPDSVGFTSLKELDLGDSHPNREDMESLSKAITGGKLPQLTELNLSNNTLTGCMSSLMGGPDSVGFTSLKELQLYNTDLNREDMESLNKAITGGKLPQLRWRL